MPTVDASAIIDIRMNHPQVKKNAEFQVSIIRAVFDKR